MIICLWQIAGGGIKCPGSWRPVSSTLKIGIIVLIVIIVKRVIIMVILAIMEFLHEGFVLNSDHDRNVYWACVLYVGNP